MKNRIKIVVTEDQSIFRKTLIAYLQGFNDFEVVAEASNGKELIDILKKQRPDIVLLDLNMPVMDGWQAFDIIRQRFEDVKVIVFSNTNCPEKIFNLIEKGANSFICKCDDVECLFQTINEVHSKGFFLSKKLVGLRRDYMKRKTQDQLFSERETQIMKEVCKGFSNNQISKRLFITPKTVGYHKQNIYRKTRSKNVVDVVRFAIKSKLFSFD